MKERDRESERLREREIESQRERERERERDRERERKRERQSMRVIGDCESIFPFRTFDHRSTTWCAATERNKMKK